MKKLALTSPPSPFPSALPAASPSYSYSRKTLQALALLESNKKCRSVRKLERFLAARKQARNSTQVPAPAPTPTPTTTTTSCTRTTVSSRSSKGSYTCSRKGFPHHTIKDVALADNLLDSSLAESESESESPSSTTSTESCCRDDDDNDDDLSTSAQPGDGPSFVITKCNMSSSHSHSHSERSSSTTPPFSATAGTASQNADRPPPPPPPPRVPRPTDETPSECLYQCPYTTMSECHENESYYNQHDSIHQVTDHLVDMDGHYYKHQLIHSASTDTTTSIMTGTSSSRYYEEYHEDIQQQQQEEQEEYACYSHEEKEYTYYTQDEDEEEYPIGPQGKEETEYVYYAHDVEESETEEYPGEPQGVSKEHGDCAHDVQQEEDQGEEIRSFTPPHVQDDYSCYTQQQDEHSGYTQEEQEESGCYPQEYVPPEADPSPTLALAAAAPPPPPPPRSSEKQQAQNITSDTPLPETATAPSWDELLETVQEQLSPASNILLSAKDSSTTTIQNYNHTSQEEELDLVRNQLMKDFFQGDHLNQPQNAAAVAAVAFYHGLQLQHNIHASTLRHLQQQLQLQSTEPPLMTSPAPVPVSPTDELPTKASSSSSTASWNNHRERLAAAATKSLRFRQYGLTAMSRPLNPAHHHHHNNDDDNCTVVTAFTTMSCRELSIERYRARFSLRQGRRPQANNNTNTTASPTAANDNDTTNKTDDNDNDNNSHIQRLLEELRQAERRQKKLEQQLQQAGIVLAEDIPYQEAKDQVHRISTRMNEIGSSQAVHDDPVVQKALREEYFRLEQDMEKYMTALMLTDEYVQEQQEAERAWEREHERENRQALERVRRHMPVDIRRMTRDDLVQKAGIPPALAKRFQRTNVLQMLRRDPHAIAKWHPCNLESLRLAGLTLTERRALHCHVGQVANILSERGTSDPLTARKMTWIRMMANNFKESLAKYQHHVQQTDRKTCADHQCSLIGKQCPVRADLEVDYMGNLGFPQGDVYEESTTTISHASSPDRSSGQEQPESSSEDHDLARKELWNQRHKDLKEHYKGFPDKVQQVSLAWGVCEAMDSLLEKVENQRKQWILQQLQSSSQDDCKVDTSFEDIETPAALHFLHNLLREVNSLRKRAVEDGLDSRSMVEIGLSEEVHEAVQDYLSALDEHLQGGREGRSKQNKASRLPTTIDKVRDAFENMHSTNVNTLEKFFPLQSPTKTRKRQSRTEIMAELWKKDKAPRPPVKSTCSGNDSKSLSQDRMNQNLRVKAREYDRKRGNLRDSIAARKLSGDSAGPNPSTDTKTASPSSLLDAIRARRS